MKEEVTDSGLIVARDEDAPTPQTRKGPHPTPIPVSPRKAKRRTVRAARRRNR